MTYLDHLRAKREQRARRSLIVKLSILLAMLAGIVVCIRIIVEKMQ